MSALFSCTDPAIINRPLPLRTSPSALLQSVPHALDGSNRMTGRPTEISVADVDTGALRVLRCLQAAGHEAVLAGGCVRDLLLGRVPVDWDIATDAAPDSVSSMFERTVSVGERFGIIRVLLDGSTYEVARFRAPGVLRAPPWLRRRPARER